MNSRLAQEERSRSRSRSQPRLAFDEFGDMQINVQNAPSTTTITLDVNTMELSIHAKMKVAVKLECGRVLSDFNVQNGSTLPLVDTSELSEEEMPEEEAEEAEEEAEEEELLAEQLAKNDTFNVALLAEEAKEEELLAKEPATNSVARENRRKRREAGTSPVILSGADAFFFAQEVKEDKELLEAEEEAEAEPDVRSQILEALQQDVGASGFKGKGKGKGTLTNAHGQWSRVSCSPISGKGKGKGTLTNAHGQWSRVSCSPISSSVKGNSKEAEEELFAGVRLRCEEEELFSQVFLPGEDASSFVVRANARALAVKGEGTRTARARALLGKGKGTPTAEDWGP